MNAVHTSIAGTLQAPAVIRCSAGLDFEPFEPEDDEVEETRSPDEIMEAGIRRTMLALGTQFRERSCWRLSARGRAAFNRAIMAHIEEQSGLCADYNIATFAVCDVETFTRDALEEGLGYALAALIRRLEALP